jgi:hypothetical protein
LTRFQPRHPPLAFNAWTNGRFEHWTFQAPLGSFTST